MAARRAWWPWPSLALIAACGAAPTQVAVRVATDLTAEDGVDAIEVLVVADDGTIAARRTIEGLSDSGGFVEIGSFGVVPRGGDASRRFEVVAVARFGGQEIFRTRARTGFVAGQTIRLDVYVASQCLGIARRCETDETCGVAGCTSADVDPVGQPSSPGGELDGSDPRGDSPMATLGEGCSTSEECAPASPECTTLWWGGARTACMRPCAGDDECAAGSRCILEHDERLYCAIGCDPVRPFEGCPEGTHCVVVGGEDPFVWATHCGDWWSGNAPRYADCDMSSFACAPGLICHSHHEGVFRCTDPCEVTPDGDRGCPEGFYCFAQFVDSVPGRTYGSCLPFGDWPPPP